MKLSFYSDKYEKYQNQGIMKVYNEAALGGLGRWFSRQNVYYYKYDLSSDPKYPCKDWCCSVCL